MVFQNTESIFFLLLRSGLYGKPIPENELPENIDWKTVIVLAKKQAVVGIIIDSVQYLPEPLRPSDSVIAKMNKFAIGILQANMLLDKTVVQLVTFFNQHDIPGVLLKGQGIARCYRIPQMRQSGDIDFYVGKTIYKKAVDLCLDKLIADKDACHETEHHFNFDIGDVSIELHRLATRIYSPFRRKMFQNWIVEQLEHSPDRRIMTIGNTDVVLPPLGFDAIFIFYHAWRHYVSGGVGLRQLCDWSMLFHSHCSEIDTDQLIKNIRRFGMTTAWKLFACIAVEKLGLSEEKMPLYDPSYRKKSEKIFEEIIAGGNFGTYLQDNIRTRSLGHSVGDEFCKLGIMTKNFMSLVPLIPMEAIFHYFHNLADGVKAYTRRLTDRSKRS